MTFYRAILEPRDKPTRVGRIQAITLLGAKREAYREYAHNLPDGGITLESWDGVTYTGDIAEKKWIPVASISLGYGNRQWNRR